MDIGFDKKKRAELFESLKKAHMQWEKDNSTTEEVQPDKPKEQTEGANRR